jgi:CRISPR-associated protein Csy3
MAKKDRNTASVLAFEKKLVPSDGFMYGTTWDNRHDSKLAIPLKLKEKSVRGTISNRLPAKIQNDPLKLNAKVENPNLQRVDSCGLAMEQDTLKLSFTLKVLSDVQTPSACNNQEFGKTYKEATEKYIEEEKFSELGKRYAMNIANGRFLWRNRVGAESIEVQVNALNAKSKQSWEFVATELSIRDFASSNDEIDSLGKEIAKALSGEMDFLLLSVDAYAQVGKAQDVYPSEELVLDKGNSKTKKSKILYDIDGIAGMHSQKIGNALRSIDSWYPDYSDAVGPIAIEPYGAVTNLGQAFRNPKAKADFFTLFDKFARGETLENKNDEHYVMAVLVRGGVFGESEK